jgi:hypothetical protein
MQKILGVGERKKENGKAEEKVLEAKRVRPCSSFHLLVSCDAA